MMTSKKITLSCILVISALMIPTVSALEFRKVDNFFDAFSMVPVRELNGVTKYEWYSEQTWSGGGWDGTVVQGGFMHQVSSTGTQVWIGEGVFTGTIDGKVGTVVYKVHQFVPNGDFSQLEGKCTIVRGTGELKGICGYGNLIVDDFSTEWYIRIP
jgi:hypothetical protein